MATSIPEVINDSRTYLYGNADDYMTTEFEMPEIAALTSDVEGAGIAGKIEAPIAGQFDSMESKITIRVPTAEAMKLVASRPIDFENYADVQRFNSGSNAYEHSQMRTALRDRIKSSATGSIKRGETTDMEVTIEVHYIKVDFDGDTVIEIDKFGHKAIVNGVDLLAEVRKNIGM